MKNLNEVIEVVETLPGYEGAKEQNGLAVIFVTDYMHRDFQDALLKLKIPYMSMFKGDAHMTMAFTFKLS